MSISYSGITNYGKANLPSVESWGTNNNILRDPPRSVTTRRIDKVFDTAMIDQEIQESGNRVAESIRVYPRGANVMVGVSFNNSNSVGNRGNSIGGQQAKLPYRVMRDGVFRPPILRPVNLLPLSRLPRNNVTVEPIANTVDFKRKLVCPGTAKDYRSVKDNLMQVEKYTNKIQNIRKPVEIGVGQNIQQDRRYASADAQKTQNISRPVQVAVGQNIQDRIHANAETAKTRKVDRIVPVSVGQSIQDHLKANANTNIRKYDFTPQSVKYTDDSVKGEMIHYQTQSNPARNIQVRVVDPTIVYQPNARVQASTQSNIKGIGKQYLLHEKQELRDKPILRGEISVNGSQRGRYNPQVQPTSTNYYLPQKPKAGGMEGNPLIPTTQRSWGERTLKGGGFADLMKQK